MAVFDSKNIDRQYAEIMKSIAESEAIKKAIKENRPLPQ